ncbi:hypothetical protein KL920_003819 [Ogataea angusta]|nr:hypothetical protein KL920_003819 [Ogataea angusta]
MWIQVNAQTSCLTATDSADAQARRPSTCSGFTQWRKMAKDVQAMTREHDMARIRITKGIRDAPSNKAMCSLPSARCDAQP